MLTHFPPETLATNEFVNGNASKLVVFSTVITKLSLPNHERIDWPGFSYESC